MPGELWDSCLAMSAEIATTAGESVSYAWKRAAAAGKYSRPKCLCLASCVIAVSYAWERAAVAGEYGSPKASDGIPRVLNSYHSW